MSRRRLLMVIDEMEVGGSQRQIVHLLTGLDREYWQPELACFRGDSFLVAQLETAGIKVHRLPKRSRIDLRFLAGFTRLLRRGNYDLVHAFSLTAELWSVIAGMASRRRLPIIASERNQQQRQPAWYWWLKRFVLAHSVAAIANSVAGARTTAQHTGLPPAFFDTIPNGVPIPSPISDLQRESIRVGLGVPASRALALFVGRLVPQKNLECLVAAMEQLEPEHRPWLTIAGDGPLREQLQREANSGRARDGIHFIGERDDATRLMQAADFLVLPSHFEGLPNVLLEAMAAGCPVIASQVAGNAEVVENERTGLLFRTNDPAALAGCLRHMGGDIELRTRLSAQARDHVVRHYGIPALVAATVAVYERCLLTEQPASVKRVTATGLGCEDRVEPVTGVSTWNDAND